MDYKRIGERIRVARKNRAISQEELAEKVDISVTHMSHIETGTTKLSLQVLVDIARVLEVSTDALLQDKAEMPSAMDEITSALKGCDPVYAQVIANVVSATRKALEKHL